MQAQETNIPDVKLIQPKRFGDDRGWFLESWNKAMFEELGLDFDWTQDNHSFSAQKDTLRGLHYQTPPNAQDKLVRCTRGSIWDVAVDFRKGSPTYLQHVSAELNAANGHQLLVPKGFLHGFLTLEKNCEVQYKCSALYSPECDAGIRWDDPQIAINWPLSGDPVLSIKDAEAPHVAGVTTPF